MPRRCFSRPAKVVLAFTSLGFVIMIIGSHFWWEAISNGQSTLNSQLTPRFLETCHSSDTLTNVKLKSLMFPDGMDVRRMAEEHIKRRELLHKTCKAGPEENFFEGAQAVVTEGNQFLIDDVYRLLYCPIEKVGCSFWKRVFVLLKNHQQGKSVFNLSGVAVHRRWGLFNTSAYKPFILKYFYLHSYTKFLFVRDPYERLFSGYIDKIFTPSYQTQGLSEQIRHRFGENLQPAAMGDGNLGNQTTSSFSCVTGISFSEFCRYITNEVGVAVNAHFTPMYTKCLPCHAGYDLVGKMETFRDDTNFILAAAGVNVTSVLGPDSSFQTENDLSIMRDVTKRTFDVIRSDKRKCFHKANMLRRTWATFQIRGYLSIHKNFPVSDELAEFLTNEQFVDLAVAAYKTSGSREECMRQRKMALLEAFHSITRSLLKKVEIFVGKDCTLFGYECSVDQRFPENQGPQPLFKFDTMF